jgi:uncharacterized protein (DUF952 family)
MHEAATPRLAEPMDLIIYHIGSRAALAAARDAGEYRADSLALEGFIHLSRAHQVAGTARTWFRGVPDLVVLAVNPARLSARLVYEPPAPPPRAAADAAADAAATAQASATELFPHCYGPIDLAAIDGVLELSAFGAPG